MIAHNGEINTARGNVNWMRAREAVLSSDALGDDLAGLPAADRRGRLRLGRLRPRARADGARRPTAPQHAMMMMIPAAWEGRRGDAGRARGLLPLPRPAAGALGRSRRDRLLRRPDPRRDARPQRPPPRSLDDHPRRLGLPRLGVGDLHRRRPTRSPGWAGSSPAQLFVVDLEHRAGPHRRRGRGCRSPAPLPTASGTRRASSASASCPTRTRRSSRSSRCCKRQLAFGYTQEDLRTLLAPLLRDGREPTGSMGNDLSLAVFSDHRPSLYSYFKQRFAQVTNPAIDSVREQRRDEPAHRHRPAGQPAERRAAGRQPRRARAPDPHRLRARAAAPQPPPGARTRRRSTHLRARQGRGRARGRPSTGSATRRSRRSHEDTTLLVISATARPGADRVPIPSLLACSTVHHALVREGTRLRAALVVESRRAARDPPPRGADRLRRRPRSTRT